MASIDSVKTRYGAVGHTPKLIQAIEIAIQVAPTDVSVLIVGENGTGKDVFSRIIHQFGKRKHQPFIAINTGAIPEGTMDSELSGHERGSFTGAVEGRKGYSEEVDGGTIFLDEIGEMPMATQARLLRVLENKEYLRVGSSKPRKTDVRVITATNKNLIEQIRKGKFREDLFFRLNTITIQVPPLRDRGQDIEMLFQYFADEFAHEYKRNPLILTQDAADMLYQYRWPGNVRELRNFVQRMTVLLSQDVVTSDLVREHLDIRESYLPAFPGQRTGFGDEEAAGSNRKEMEMMGKAIMDLREEVTGIKKILAGGVPSVRAFEEEHDVDEFIIEQKNAEHRPRAPISYASDSEYTIDHREPQEAADAILLDQPLNLEHNEKYLITRALEKHNDNRKKAAQELGISERTLYRKIKQYEIN